MEQDENSGIRDGDATTEGFFVYEITKSYRLD